MKAQIAFSTVALALAACLINLNVVANAQLKTSQPGAFTFTESAIERECSQMSATENGYLKIGDYDNLDEYASELRNSRESWATGHWKLGSFYAGFSPSDSAPDDEWETRLQELQDWVDAKPDSITARVALAYTLNCYGWRERDTSPDVPNGDWRPLLQERLLRAGAVLDGAEKLNEKCPVYWSLRMIIALGLGTDRKQFDEIFEQATNSAPYYYDTYYYHRAEYLLPRPRRFGEPGEWEATLAKEADQIGGEKGDEVYAQVVWCVHQSGNPGNIFFEYRLSWHRVDRGFAVIEKEYPDSADAKNERAFLAIAAGDRASARKYFDQMAGTADLRIWRTKQYFMSAYNWAHQ